MAHGQAQCLVGLKKSYTGMDGWPCQRVSPHKDSESASGSAKILSWVITPLGWRSREFGHFWGTCGFVVWITRHRIASRARTLPTACSRKSLKEGKRKMSNLDGWSSGNLPCILSPLPLHDLLRIQPQPQNARWSLPLESDCISPIGLYTI